MKALPARQELTDDMTLASTALSEGLAALGDQSAEEAEHYFKQALRYQAPHYATTARVELALLRLEQGDADAAVAWLRDAEKTASGLEDPEVLLHLASAWHRAGHPACAAWACGRLLQDLGDAPTDDGPRLAAAQTHMLLARLAPDLEPKGDPEAHYERAATLRDSHVSPFALIELAVRRSAHQGQSKYAEWLLREALTYDHPIASSEAAFELASLLTARGQVHEARELLDKVWDEALDMKLAEKASAALDELPKGFVARTGRPAVKRRVPVGRAPRRVLIVGGGTGGQYCVEDLLRDARVAGRYSLIGFADGNPSAPDLVSGVGRLGDLADVPTLIEAHQLDEIWLTMPRVAPDVKRGVVLAACAYGVQVRTLPLMHDLARPIPLHRQLRPVAVADVVGHQTAEEDVEAGAWLRHRRLLIVGCGTVGTHIALAAMRAGVSSITLLDRNEVVLRDLTHLLGSVHGFENVKAYQGSSIDGAQLAHIVKANDCEVMYHATGGWGHALWEPLRQKRVIDGIASLVELLPDRPSLEKMIFLTDEPPAWVTTPGDALDVVAESILLSRTDARTLSRAVVHAPAIYTSTRSVIADLARDVASGANVKVPPPPVSCRFEHAHRVAELALHAGRIMTGGELFAIDSGDDVSIRQLAAWMLEIEGCAGLLEDDAEMIVSSSPGPIGEQTEVPGLIRVRAPHAGQETHKALARLADQGDHALIEAARALGGETSKALVGPPIGRRRRVMSQHTERSAR